MSRNDGIKRCVWCGEPGDREHPIVQEEDGSVDRGDNYHDFCLVQRDEEKKNRMEKNNE